MQEIALSNLSSKPSDQNFFEAVFYGTIKPNEDK